MTSIVPDMCDISEPERADEVAMLGDASAVLHDNDAASHAAAGIATAAAAAAGDNV